MLNNISWQGYWATLALLTAGYYLVIYLRYFRKDLQVFLQQRRPSTTSPSATPAVAAFLKEQTQPSPFSEDTGPDFQTPAEGEESLVYAFIDELNAYFESARKAKVMKAEVLFAVQRILQKYPSLNESSYKESIGNVIRTEAEHHCSVHLSEEEISKVWMMT